MIQFVLLLDIQYLSFYIRSTGKLVIYLFHGLLKITRPQNSHGITGPSQLPLLIKVTKDFLSQICTYFKLLSSFNQDYCLFILGVLIHRVFFFAFFLCCMVEFYILSQKNLCIFICMRCYSCTVFLCSFLAFERVSNPADTVQHHGREAELKSITKSSLRP